MRVNSKLLKAHRYYCKKTGKDKVSGYPQDWLAHSVFENPDNPRYRDNINFKYDFPHNFNSKQKKYYYMREGFNNWKNNNPIGTVIKYYRWEDRDLHLYKVKIIGYGDKYIKLCRVSSL